MNTSGPTQTARPLVSENTWRGHPRIASLLRLIITLLPTLVSFAATFAMARYLPPQRLGVSTPVWWLMLFAVGSIVLLGTDRLTRRLLPLAALFRLTLIFPDRAPSRFATAMRSGTTRQLERRIAEVQDTGSMDPDDHYAQQMLELVAALSVHDRLTRGHCERVRAYTDMISEEMKLSAADASRLRWAALIHDVGKLFVPASILNKEGRPSEDEWEVLQSHTWRGQRLAEPLSDWLGPWVRAVGEHHERWEGGGYPYDLSGTDIHLGARIVAVADAFDVMTSKRSYKEPMPAEAARAEIQRCAGTQFDPQVVRAFLNIGLGRLRLAMGPLAWLANLPSVGRLPIAPVTSPLATAGTAAVATIAAAITGGFGGLLVPNPPETLAFSEPIVAETSEPATAEPTPSTVAPDSGPTTTAPADPTTTTTSTAPADPTTTTARTPITVPLKADAVTTTTTQTTPTTNPARRIDPPAPGLQASSPAVHEDQPADVTLQVASSTGDVELSVLTPPTKGEIRLETATVPGVAGTPGTTNVTLVYTPNPNLNGSDRVVLQGCDPAGRCTTLEVPLQIRPVNDAPTATPVSVTIDEDQPFTVPTAELLARTVDVDGDLLTIAAVRPTDPSVLEVGSAPDWSLTTEEHFHGFASVEVDVCDPDGLCTTTTVDISVRPVNDPPTIGVDQIGLAEDGTVLLDQAELLANDLDVDGDSLTVTVGTPEFGEIVPEGPGGWRYVPDPNAGPSDSIATEVCDGTVCVDGIIEVSVANINDPPAANDDVASVLEDNTLLIASSDLLANDTDPDLGDELTAKVTRAEHGTVTGLGPWVYTPDPDFSGTDTLTVEVCDRAGSCINSHLIITVEGINDAPVITPAPLRTTEDSPTTFSLAVDDPEDTTVTVTWSQPTLGEVTANPDGTWTFTPDSDVSGIEGVLVTACDTDDRCGAETVLFTVTAQNDLPVATDDTATVLETETLDIVLEDLAANDYDLESATLTVQLGSPTHGTLNGLTYTPVENDPTAREDIIEVTVCDTDGGCTTSTLYINVVPLNDPPVSNLEVSHTLDEDQTYQLTPAHFGLADADGDEITVRFANLDKGTIEQVGQNWMYRPITNWPSELSPTSQEDSIEAVVCDGTVCESHLFSMNVRAVNDPPIAVTDKFDSPATTTTFWTSELLANDIELDGQSLRIVAFGPPQHGSVSINAVDGLVQYQRTGAGDDWFSYSVCDDSNLCSVGRVVMTASPNTAPTIGSVSTTINEDSRSVLNADSFDATDADGDDLHLSISTTGPNSDQLRFDVIGQDFWLAVPSPDFHGTVDVDIEVCDGQDCTVQAGTVVVAPAADTPQPLNDVIQNPEDASLVIDANQLLDNDYWVDAAPTVILGPPTTGTITGTGPWTYTPQANAERYTEIEVYVCSGDRCGTSTLTIENQPIPELPVIGAAQLSSREDTAAILTPHTLGAYAPDGGAVTLSITTDSPYGTLEELSPTRYRFTPNPDYWGQVPLQVQVCDQLSCSTGSVNLDIEPVNDAPTIDHQSTATMAVGVPATIRYRATDDEANTVVWSAAGLPPGLTMNATTGHVTGIAHASSAGQTYRVTITATDSGTPSAASSIVTAMTVQDLG